MGKKIINTQKIPASVGPYSQAVEMDGILFLSGQISSKIGADITIQAREVLDNIRILLEEAGLRLENVVKTTVYLTDLSKFSIVNEVYEEYFPKEPPARSTVEVKGLPKGAGIEIDVIAMNASASTR